MVCDLSQHVTWVLVLGCFVASAGCSQSAGRVTTQVVDPGAAASRAMDLHDSDGDDLINEQEAKASPGLHSAFPQFDSDGDGHLSSEEISSRLQSWVDSKIALYAISCSVLLDHRPLVDAKVVLEPEPFLGETFQALEGVTSRSGTVKFPTLEGMPGPGILTGLYRIRITKTHKGKEMIPDKYNTNTILGQEVSADAPGMGDRIVLKLSSK